MSIVKKPGAIANWYLPGILIGMIFTLKKMIYNLFHKDKMPTLNYPEEKYEYSPRFKGQHVLTVKKDGSIRCTACMLCATNCPAQCIKIVASEHEDPTVEKYPINYEIDVLRCVYCGFCEEACPVDAIRMGPEWQKPGANGFNFTYDIQELAYRPQLKGGIESRLDEKERHDFGI
ncbi:MAG: NADH-quinone oxidoreductase subunit I [Bdellovibrionaceae bacterium]|nr:NADH-quinone oxidoreductase subunit I [Pseudobdellovibrionaceae bacterium]